LRITRETELLGGQISSTHSRENVVLQTKFLSKDLPYFAELLAEVATQTKFAGELSLLKIDNAQWYQHRDFF
jgi:ubiquinol-cytochrome c reductase core subunit 2